ncbi:MAG: glutamate--tRNA ligase, partial [Deltaproteobacteria bacterium]|nr:glutamate--tRNA ligase [Deltaproteobacteria bacterium]
EVFSLTELVEAFAWDRCNKSDGRFDPAKLTAIAFEHLKRPELRPDDDYLARLTPWLEKQYGSCDESTVRAVLPHIRPRAKTLREAAESLNYLFADELSYDEKAKKKFLMTERAQYLRPLHDLMASTEPFEAATLEEAVKQWAEADQLKLGAIAQPARVALTGRTASPGLFDVMVMLGRDKTLERLAAAAALAGEG